MKMRLYQNNPAPKRPTGPMTPAGWANLMARVIERANEAGDKRLGSLTKALADGRAEKMLRTLGILSEVDIAREFPE